MRDQQAIQRAAERADALRGLRVTDNMLPGYRPYHSVDCWARVMEDVDRMCTCGGLDKPVWRPGDEPKT